MAERLNRTLIESARSMLLDAKLPKSYWAEAMSTATYLKTGHALTHNSRFSLETAEAKGR